MGRTGQGTMNVSVSITPNPYDLEKGYYAATGKMMDWHPAFAEMLPGVASGVNAILSQEGSPLADYFPGKVPWRPLSGHYLYRKVMSGVAAMMMRYSGHMLSGMGVLGMSRSAMRYGVTAPQARAIQFGAKAGHRRKAVYDKKDVRVSKKLGVSASREWKKYTASGMPARPFLGVTAQIIAAARSAFDHQVSDALEEIARAHNSTSEAVVA